MTDSQILDLSVSFGNKRYRDARAGIDALADSLGKSADDFGHVVAREMRAYIDRQTATLARRHSGPQTTEKALAKRTGRLTRGLNRGGEVFDPGGLDDVYGRIALPGDYRTQEYGATLRPKSGNYLFIPLPAALGSNGRPKKLNPRQWSGTFIAESRKGNLLLFRRVGRKIEPLYALKRTAKVRPRLGLVREVKRGFPAFADRALEALLETITENSN